MAKLPTEVFDLILSYEGSLKERNGKHMRQIPKTDERYAIIDRILFKYDKYYSIERYRFSMKVINNPRCSLSHYKKKYARKYDSVDKYETEFEIYKNYDSRRDVVEYIMNVRHIITRKKHGYQFIRDKIKYGVKTEV